MRRASRARASCRARRSQDGRPPSAMQAIVALAPCGTDVILPHGFKVKQTFTSWNQGIDGRLTRLLNAFASPNKDIYQFGVYTGTGLKKIGTRVKGFGHLWGFDSFRGIPDEPKAEQVYWTNDFRQGGYSAADALGVYNLTALMHNVARYIDRPNMTLVPGFFNESLNADLLQRYRLQPALHVDVDVDIFTSTLQCLSWMFENRLIVPSTFVRYDDWPNVNATHGKAAGTTFYGQKKAHALLTQRFNVEWKPVATNSYQVVAIGSWRCEETLCDRAPRWPEVLCRENPKNCK